MKSDITPATGRATIHAAKISQDEQYLDSAKDTLSKSTAFTRMVTETRLSHPEDLRARAMILANLVMSRATKESSIHRMANGLQQKWERLCNAEESIFERAMWTASRTFLSHFFNLPDVEQRNILGGWTPVLGLMGREEIEECSGFAAGASVVRVLNICGANECHAAEAYQYSETNQGRASDVSLTISEGVSQQNVLQALQAMLRMVQDNWAEMIALAPDSAECFKEKSGPLAGDDSRLLGGVQGDEVGEQQTAVVKRKGKQRLAASMA